MKVKNALISVSDKSGLDKILRTLKKFRVNFISSGGTYKKIKSLGYMCTEVSSYTGFPEILDGRVKTLHPKIHSGILYKRKNIKHRKTLKKLKFEGIDLVITNFYPFKNKLSQTKNHNRIIENIDIGGPTLVRSAAKNYKDVVVITSTDNYKLLINELNLHNGNTTLKFRLKMSETAFGETASYDAQIYNYLNSISKKQYPKKLFIDAELKQILRYGENPHQIGALYVNHSGLNLTKLGGKELSYNNYNDIFACLKLSKTLPKNKGVVIVKHANPSGVSIENNHLKSYISAFNCDPVSSFGGIVACNFKLNQKTSREILKRYFEVIIANGFENNALNLLRKKKNLRLIDASKIAINQENKIISGVNSILTQKDDNLIFNKNNFKVVSNIKPSGKLFNQLIFSFNVCRSVKSNGIVIVQNYKTLGIGSGQPSRLDSCEIAIKKMKKFRQFNNKDPIIAASDAFFPFIDGVEKLVQAGVSAIIQPYGSIRDKEIIRYANDMGITLVFSKTRHFNH